MDTESGFRQAKRPASVIAGPYGHPMHAVLITLPIGSWTASLVFDVLAFITGEQAYALGATWLIGIGIVGALFAMIFGFMDYNRLPAGTKVNKVATTHMVLNIAATAVMFGSVLVRVVVGPEEVNFPGFVLSVLAMILVGASGYLGGNLAYKYGVRVADEETQRQAYQQP
ncbi:MAG: hypothetical protein JWP66_344 [Naasia sp.]|nr:hypothetical protein [Naasia sp.]